MVDVKPYDEDEARKVNHVEVLSHRKVEDHGVVLATITASVGTAGKDRAHVVVVENAPMTHEEAVQAALEYAVKNKIGVVYDRNVAKDPFFLSD